MIARAIKVLKFAVVCAMGFAIAGAVLGLMHTTESEWMWYGGFALIGAFAGVGLALVTGRFKKLIQLLLAGAVVGAASWYMVSTSGSELWLQLTIIGALFGAFTGIVLALMDKEKKPAVEKNAPKAAAVEPPAKKFECDECGHMVGEDDNFCASCGTEFE
jgi:RsiW-degrading membrane proteinase PrsW (M82 family)